MAPPSTATRRIVIGPEGDGRRVDVALAAALGMSRRTVQALLDEGVVRDVRGRPAQKGGRAAAGDVFDVRIDASALAEESGGAGSYSLVPDPEAAARVSIVYEDAALIAIDKPGGMPTHPLKEGERGTAANAMAARFPELARVGPAREGGVVHRLDATTSGLLCFARTDAAYTALRGAFSAGLVSKAYLALCLGSPPDRGECALAIGHPSRGAAKARAYADERRAAKAYGALPALTRFETLERFEHFALVRARAYTGRMHQVRVHLAAIGHPLAGDALYQDEDARARDQSGVPRVALHAASIELDHPLTGAPLHLESPLAADLEVVVSRLRRLGPKG